MSKNYMHKTEIHSIEDAEGNVQTTTKETLTKFQRSEEPDYIKLYTEIWTRFNGIPPAYRGLFLELATRMSYANSSSPNEAQVVYVFKQVRENIMAKLGWKLAMLKKGLTELVKCNAIKRLSNGIYQINPTYAGKGEWKYNPKLQQGGIEDIIATFSFKNKTVDTQIVWADDGTKSELNDLYRQGLNVCPDQEAVLKTTTATSPSDAPTSPPDAPTSHENSFNGILQGRFWNGKIYANNKVYLNNTEVLLSDEQVELLKTHKKYIA